MQYVKPEYDRKNNMSLDGSTHQAALFSVLRDMENMRKVTVRDLYSATSKTLSDRQVIWSTVLLRYWLEEKNDELLAYLSDTETNLTPEARFKRHFKVKSYEEMQESFVAWLETKR